MEKTHYRKVFKSDHLGTADLEELIEDKIPLIFTIKEVKQEYNVSVAGKKINANIAYFKEHLKPLVLNATNSKIVKSFANGSPFVEDWKNIKVELYIDASIKLKGEVVGGVRIKTQQPKSTDYSKQKELLKSSKNIEELKANYTAIGAEAQRELVSLKDELKNKLS